MLASGMIAVTYNETDKTWVKADSSKTDWYDYSNQMWANAVTVTEETRATYMDLAVGEPISMDDINTMWVWIPRYSYTIAQSYGRTEQKCSELGEITIDSPRNCRKIEYEEESIENVENTCNSRFGTTDLDMCAKAMYLIYEGCVNPTAEDLLEYLAREAVGTELEVKVKSIETYPNNYVTETNTPGEIDIKFISKEEKHFGTGQCEKCAENWVTPEGFTFGNEELSGFWIGKFETTGSIGDACVSEECTTADLTIKPNLNALINQNVSSFFYASRSMQNSNNASKYGFDVISVGTMDTHMSKNTEWGIVTYLSQSKYGKYGNSNYEGVNKEVYNNTTSTIVDGNYTAIITGGSLGKPSNIVFGTETIITYDVPDTGYGASTTGTIYGVYDMSGGSEEYVMGNYNNISGESSSANSGFCGTLYDGSNIGTCVEWPEAKYYDLYTSTDAATAYKTGDATYETATWYKDIFYFVDSRYPWFLRGGYSDWDAAWSWSGIFGLNDTRGSEEKNSFRITLKP